MPLYSPCEYFIVLRLNSVVCPYSDNCIVTHVPNYPLASVPCTSVYCGSCVTVVIVVCQWSGPLSRLPPRVCSMYFSMSRESCNPVLTVLSGYVHSRLFRCFCSVYFSISRYCVPVLAVLSDYVHSRLSLCFCSVYFSISRSCVPVLTVLSGYVHSRLSRCLGSVYFSTSRDMCPGCRPTDSAFWLYPSPAVLMSFCSVYINMSPES